MKSAAPAVTSHDCMASFSVDDLTKHAASLHALARDLLGDDALAEDAVQQACVTALTRPPVGSVTHGAWLRAVVHSCAIDLWRSEQRRRNRELQVARSDATEVRDSAEQLELHFVLPRGLDVIGIVHDERQRLVVGAAVVLVSPRKGWLGGRVVATSDMAGAFSVRSVPATWSLGARALGYAPSRLVDLEDVERPDGSLSVDIRLKLLQPGAAVAGRIVDENGAGIPGAVVILGHSAGGHREASRTRESWNSTRSVPPG